MGFKVDPEADGLPDATALGDDADPDLTTGDDEDGVVTIGDKLYPGVDFTLSISGTQGSVLDAWFDFDADGILEPSEHSQFLLTGTWTKSRRHC